MKSMMAALLLVPGLALATPRELQIAEVWGATEDVHDIVTVADRTLVATSGGLIERRAGQRVRVITAREGLPGTRLRSVSATPQGVWVGALEGAALLAWDEAGTVRVVQVVDLPRVRRVVSFAGATWFATFGGGLYRAIAGGRPTRVALGANQALPRQTDLAVFGGSLWIATSGAGLVRLGPTGVVLSRLRAAQGLASDLIWDLEPESDRLLVATAAGLSVIGATGNEPEAAESVLARRLPIRDVRSVHRVGDAVWVATFGAGAFHLVPGAAPAPVAAPGCLRVRVIAEEDGGVLLGHDAGLVRVEPDGEGARAQDGGPSGLLSADVTSLSYAFGKLWLGTFDRGLVVLAAGRARPVDRALSRWGMDRRINDLGTTRDGSGHDILWIATDRGLYEHDGRRFSPAAGLDAPAMEHVSDLHVDAASGELWVASTTRVSRRDRQGRWTSWRGTPERPFAQLAAVTTDARGGIWLGSLHGLFRLDPTTGQIARHTVSSGALPVDWVTALAPWRDGVVAGTYNGGLVWFDGQAFRSERAVGAPRWVNPHAFGVVGDSLWVGTLSSGVVVGGSTEWAALGTAGGLPSQDVTAIVPAGDGSAWVATRGGLARVLRLP